MAAKLRVFQVAKEFNISNEALIAYLAKLDYQVSSHMSPLSDEMYDEVCKKYKKDIAGSPDSDDDFRKRLKEKKQEDEKRKERAKRELEERIRLAQEIAKTPMRRKEPSKEEVLKIAKAEAKAEAQAELRQGGRSKAPKEEYRREGVAPEAHDDGITPQTRQSESMMPEELQTAAIRDQQPGAPTNALEASTPAAEIEQLDSIAEPSQKKRPGKTLDTTVPVDEDEITQDKKKKGKLKGDEQRHEKGAVVEDEATSPDQTKGKKKKRKKKKRKISDEEIEASIKQTLAAMGDAGRAKKRRHKTRLIDDEVEFDEKNVIKVSEFISASDLAKLMDVEPSEVLKKCLELGMMVSINQRLDMDTITAVADEFGFEIEQEDEYGSVLVEDDEEIDDPGNLKPRSPVVTIMGHVDHGKTSLLDFIRRSNIIAGEAGGITQHIGAYEVTFENRRITFLDTPGHEAFTAMRARGAQATDIVILVVAADDGVQKQTLEAINHAKAAGVPIVVAINKIDKPNANPDQIKQQLSQHNILVESWGGKYQSAEISAKMGNGVDKLLELVLLEADVLELKANPDRAARGIVIESELDRGKGPIATVLVQTGTLKVGDIFIAGMTHGRVRAMLDERGKRVKSAPPSTPVRVVGFSGVPQAGDKFVVMEFEKDAKDISLKRQQLRREQDMRKVKLRTLDQISKQIREGAVRDLRVIVKGDVDGSVEAIADSLMKLSTSEVAVDVIHKGVGGISETDVNLAAASNAIIIGFNVRVSLQARDLADQNDIDIRLYKIIYDAVDDVRSALEGLLEPETKEEVSGTIEVRNTFKVPKIGTIAGCYVLSGKVKRSDQIRLYRDDKLTFEGKIISLKRFKDDVREVASGFECGLGIEGFSDIHVGDIIECVQFTEVKRTLSV